MARSNRASRKLIVNFSFWQQELPQQFEIPRWSYLLKVRKIYQNHGETFLTQRPDKFSLKTDQRTRETRRNCVIRITVNESKGIWVEERQTSRWRTAYTKMAAECLVAWNLILPHRSPGSDSGPLSFAPSFFLFPLWLVACPVFPPPSPPFPPRELPRPSRRD